MPFLPPLILAFATARADPGAAIEIAPGQFKGSRADATFEVTKLGMPDPVGIDPTARICRVSIRWTAGSWEAIVHESCNPKLAETAAEAARRSTIAVSPPARDRELFEYWYVFPTERGGTVRPFVRQAHDQDLVLTDERIDVLSWSVKARVQPEYPTAAVGADTSRTICEAKIGISPSGTPGEIAVYGCDEVFVAPLRATLRKWRWGTPELDGTPFFSGITLAVQFMANIDDPSQPGTTAMRFPANPDLGSRTLARETAPVAEAFEPVPAPEGKPLFMVDHRSFAEIGVYEIHWPEVAPSEVDRRCDVLFQVNSIRRVWAWPEDCDASVRDPTVLAAQQWRLMHGKIEPGERYARFRGTFFYPAGGGHPELRIPAGDLKSRARGLPDHVRTYAVAKTIRSVPPKLPRGFATETLDQIVLCDFDVAVSAKGRPDEIRVRRCPGAYTPYAEKAIRQWRWTPASADGKEIASRVVARIRFDQRL